MQKFQPDNDTVVFSKSKKLIKIASVARKNCSKFYSNILPYSDSDALERVFSDSYYKLEQTINSIIHSFTNLYLPSIDGKNSQLYLYLKDIIVPDYIAPTNCSQVNPDNTNRIIELTYTSLVNVIDKFEVDRYIKSVEIDYVLPLIQLSVIEMLGCKIKSDLLCLKDVEYAMSIIYACDSIDMQKLIQEKCRLELLLRTDPAKVYLHQARETRSHYRYLICKLARITNQDELVLTRELLSQSEQNHIGFLIYKLNQKHTNHPLRRKFHIASVYFLPAIAAAIVAIVIGQYWLIPIIYLPIIEVFRPLLEHLLTIGMERYHLPRLDFNGQVPEQFKTAVVVSTLVPEKNELESFKDKLESLALSNRNGAVYYVILADLKPADQLELPEDNEKIQAANQLVRELNALYDHRLLFLVRPREHSKTQNKFSGRERKRGAIEDLIALINGEKIQFKHYGGDKNFLENVCYILALDYDTKLLLNSVSEFVEVAAHPLNRPIIDSQRGIVTAGYGIIVPAVTIDLKESLKTPFTKIMGGIGGISSYHQGGIQLFQDIYQEGIFTGKGLIDVKAYHKVMQNKFESETVLSHDIVEGLFLRCCNVCEIEVCDGFPTSATAYFKRLHRWIRGDFQNTPFIGGKIKIDGKLVKNPINSIGKYKLFDNLRRELTPIFSLVCLLIGVFTTEKTALILAIIAISATIIPHIFAVLHDLFKGNFSAFHTKNYSRVLTGAGEVFCRALLELILLPQYGKTALDGAIRGIFRRHISKKNMLEWSTAAQVQSQVTTTSSTITFYLACIVFGVILFFSPSYLAKAVGILFLAALPIAMLTAKSKVVLKPKIKAAKREQLLNDARQMLQYYQDLCNEENNFLPPDNIQQAPVQRVAHRTSPTNIGLCLLSYLAARDLEIIDTNQLFKAVEQLIKTIKKLKTFHGNLYNWYDTKTLEVLPSFFVSTVDSGNFLCCLVSLKEGMREYSHENYKLNGIIDQIEQLISETNLSVFYNKRKQLFSIGYDSSNGNYSNSCYDMLMSEARMTSYFAIAKGQVSKKHWGSLSRTLSRTGMYCGAMAWTGTMFEYFMPELLLHCIRGSFGYESLHYCIQCQKNRVNGKDLPYGISESAIYQFDAELNFQYKANGVQRIALKREMNNDLVISPYSTYLTLSVDFEAAFENLEKLNSLHIREKYGLFEAIDFTKKRVGQQNMQVIRSYMAHHIGMSIVAIDNALNKNCMQKRFLQDKDMLSAKELLQEKMQIGKVIIMEQNKREKAGLFDNSHIENEEVLAVAHPNYPRIKLINNGELSAVIADSGTSYLIYNNTDITRKTTDILRNPLGTFCFAYMGGKVMSLTYAPTYDSQTNYSAVIKDDGIELISQNRLLKTSQQISLHRTIPCEQRKITIESMTTREQEGKLLIYLEPSLFPFADDATHKAFSKLFINVSYDQHSNTVIATRKKRGSEQICYLAVGFLEDFAFDIQTNREEIFERAEISTVKYETFTDEFTMSSGVPDPCIALRFPICLEKGEKKSFTLLSSVSTSIEDAIGHIQLLRNMGDQSQTIHAKDSFENGTFEQYLMQQLLPQVVYNCTTSNEFVSRNRLPKSSLWELSISGDYPIILTKIFEPSDIIEATAYARCASQLSICHIKANLVLICAPQLMSEVTEICKTACGENAIASSVFILDKEKLDLKKRTLLQAVACHISNKEQDSLNKTVQPYNKMEIHKVGRSQPRYLYPFDVLGGSFHKSSFFVTKTPKLPWCHILANPTFGTLMSDKAIGFTWAINARENKLTPWFNDTMQDNNGELMLLKVEGSCYNLANGAIAEFNPQFATYHGVIGELETKVQITVPKRGMIKYLEVTLKNKSSNVLDIALSYYTEPVLGVNRDTARLIKGEKFGNSLILNNPFSLSSSCYMGLTAYNELPSFSCCREEFFEGKWEQNTLPPTNDLCSAVTVKKQIEPDTSVTVTFALCFSTSKQGVEKLIKVRPHEVYFPENTVLVDTGNKATDLMINVWLPHQILAARINGRTGFYQCGGAFGFRDQLQDVCSYLPLSPTIARTHIIRCCCVQFEGGDVFHWWHALPQCGGGRKGVKTRYTDDLIWLPYALCEYVRATNDYSILSVKLRYLTADELRNDEKDRYIEANYTDYKETVYDHCKRALERAFQLGEHGLPKIGSGDWNDGYSRVGIGGVGESVWLAQFLSLTMQNFLPITSIMNDSKTAELYKKRAIELLESVDKHCYDNDHYIRAFFDNGEKMGAYSSEECKIDSLTQSFAALANMPNSDRIQKALNTAYSFLVDEKAGIIKLFTPPYDCSKQDPGYVKSYPIGVRENGGQYTHAAIWFAMAMNKLGEGEKAAKMAYMLNPINKYTKKQSADKYQTEPYYMAADIYTNPHAYGRGGWSLYTGAAGWYYKMMLDQINKVEKETEIPPTI